MYPIGCREYLPANCAEACDRGKTRKSDVTPHLPTPQLQPPTHSPDPTNPTLPAAPLCCAVSAVAGLVTTTVTSPADMVKTNMFVNGHRYSSPMHCLADIYRTHGVRGLFRG